MNQPTVTPARVKLGRSVNFLERLPKVHNEFNEGFLQKILAMHPELLPVNMLRNDAGELLSLGREIKVSSGYIDNLYLSTSGYPVLVETKLWRNPQARREVLSQTLDYIKELVQKDFDWFEKQYAQNSDGDLIEQLSSLAGELIDEQIYIDRLHRALAQGDVLSLIVGDGIETRLQELVDHLCRDTPHLRYSLGLVEMACYRNGSDQDILVVPRLIQQIDPVERAYIRIDVADELTDQKIEVTSVTPPKPKRSIRTGRISLTEDEFHNSIENAIGTKGREALEEFYTDLIESYDLELLLRDAAVMLRIPHPNGDEASASVFAFEKEGRVYNTKFLPGRLRKWGFSEADAIKISQNFWNALNQIDNRFALEGINHASTGKFIPFTDLVPNLPRIKAEIGKVVSNAYEHYHTLGSVDKFPNHSDSSFNDR